MIVKITHKKCIIKLSPEMSIYCFHHPKKGTACANEGKAALPKLTSALLRPAAHGVPFFWMLEAIYGHSWR